MKRYTLHQYCTAAMFAALVFVATAFLRIPLGEEYVHVGDALVFLAGSLLPTPLAMAAGAIGCGFADLIGYPQWLLATVIIKAASAALFTSKSKKILCARNYIATGISMLLCVGGYYLYEAMILSINTENVMNFAAPLVCIPGNAGQAIANAVVFVILALLIDQTPALRRITGHVRDEMNTSGK